MITGRRADGLLDRFLRRRRRREALDPGRPDLVVVVDCFDDAEACSTALERGESVAPALQRDAEAVLRHHLEVPPEARERVVAIAEADGYAAVEHPERLVLQRVQLLDALHCAQERSRMVGLAQRHDGDYLGWEGLQPSS